MTGGPRTPAIAWRTWAGLAGIVALTALLHGPSLDPARFHLSAEQNPAAAEARAWWNGCLDLPERLHDTAIDPRTGRVYNAFPPLLTLLSWALVAPALTGFDPVAPPLLSFLAFACVPIIVGYAIFLRLSPSPGWGVLWTLTWLLGTPLIAVLKLARDGQVYHLNHVLSQVGLLLLAADLLRWRRVWPGLIGLIIAAWSRQLTILYAMPALFVYGRTLSETTARSARATLLILAMLIAVAVPAALNWAKFGSPFESGYRLIYLGREDEFAADVHAHGLFSVHFVPRNAWYMNVAFPAVAWRDGRPVLHPSDNGASIWLTSPILVLVWLSIWNWRRDSVRCGLMLVSCVVFLALLCFHSTGRVQPGYSRFALDVVPVWMAVGATSLKGRAWGIASVAAAAWGVAYFTLL